MCADAARRQSVHVELGFHPVRLVLHARNLRRSVGSLLGVGMVWRAAAAGTSVIVAAASGMVTALITTHASRGLWIGLIVLVVVGAILQGAVTAGERRSSRRVVASGAGAVAVGGSASGEIRTHVHNSYGPAAVVGMDGVTASAPGSVSVGGDVSAPVSTELTGKEGPSAE